MISAAWPSTALYNRGSAIARHPDGDVAQSPCQRFAHDVVPLVRDVVARQQQDRGFETPGQVRQAVHEHVEQQFESPLIPRNADAGPGLDDVGYETAAAVKPVPGRDDDEGSTGFEIEAAQQVDRVPTWRRLEHERRIGYDVDRARRAGCQRRLRETVAHGNRRQRSTGDSCGRPALDVSQRPRTDRMTGDAWIQAFQQGNTCRPIGHLGATVVVLEQSAAGNEDAVGGDCGPAQPGDSGRATGDHPGNTANRWARAVTGDDRDLGGGSCDTMHWLSADTMARSPTL